MAMSKKDYEAIAEIVRTADIRYLAESLADHFAKENPRFDREKFLQAATVGLTESKDSQ